MPRKKKLIDKVVEKKFAKRCFFCEIEDYALLDVHRLIPGNLNGQYTSANTIVSCSNCHRRIHDGQIKIDRKYNSTSGSWVLHYWENDTEIWKPNKTK